MCVLFTAPLGAILAPKDGVNLAPISGDEINSFGIDIVHSESCGFFKKLIEPYVIIALHCPIFNVDESGMSLDPSKLNVICQMAVPHNWRIWSDCASTDGQVLPPYLVYSGKILYLIWTRDGYPGSRYSTSENGWMDSNVYLVWF